jgi:protein-disulfide isomerase
LSQLRLLAVLLAICLTAGCKAQTASQGASDPVLNRRIEVTVRSNFGLPQDYGVSIGARKPSSFSGYEELPVTITHGAKQQVISFLISTDSKKLARLDTFDLTADPGSTIDIAGRPLRGNPNAKVTVINFDDLECPYCARMHEALFPATLARYKDKVRFVYKDFPLAEIHPWAIHASVDANCLAAQNSDVYWTYVDYLHTHGDEVSGPDRNPANSFAALDRIARQEGTIGKLDTNKLDACLTKQDATEVNESLKEASSLGLDGAPALFVNGERINGAVPEEQVWMAIDRALVAAGEQPPATPAPPQPAGAVKPGAGN